MLVLMVMVVLVHVDVDGHLRGEGVRASDGWCEYMV